MHYFLSQPFEFVKQYLLKKQKNFLKNHRKIQGAMGLSLMGFQTLQKPAQLPVIHLANFGCVFRPPEKLLLQPFLPQAEAVPVPVQNLHHVPPPVAEDKQMPGQGVHFQVL